MHADVSLAAHERCGLERLCRYILRPPVATGRVERLADGRVRVGLKRVWSDGTTAMEFSPLELTERLAALIPPFRAHQVLYGGVLAGNAAWRGEVIPKVPSSEASMREARAALRLVKAARRSARPSPRPSRLGWAELLTRVFGVDGWRCPDCGGRMSLRTVVEGGPSAGVIARSLLRSTGPPPPRREGEDRGVCAST